MMLKMNRGLGAREEEMNQPDHVSNFILNEPIIEDGVFSICRRLKRNKAGAVDMIPNEILKSPDAGLYITKLLNLCFDYGIMLSHWLQSIISPIPKEADKDPCIPLNYRGISLLPCVCKIYTGVLNVLLTKYLEEMGLINENQNGFRKGRSVGSPSPALHR